MTSPNIRKVTARPSAPRPVEDARKIAAHASIDIDWLSGTLAALAAKHRVPGAQLAVHRGDETLAAEVGELQYGTAQQVTRDAAFPIGSVSKAFTATVAMILVADGDLDLDDPLGEHVAELHDLGVPLTLRQVLSHTSGFASDADSDDLSSSSIQRYVVDHCRQQNLMLTPGTGFSYSNIGYVLVGHLIEKITGMSWSEAVESILLQPLGIDPAFIAGSAGPARPDRPIGTGHSVNPKMGRARPVDQSLDPSMAPAGALAVSAVDLVRLGLTQVEGGGETLLPTAYAAQMRQPVPNAEPFGLADGWGLGLALFRSPDTVWVGHDGNADGTACYLRVDPQSGCVIALTSNAITGLTMWQELLAELEDIGLSITKYSTSDALGEPTPPPPGCLGTYQNGDIEYSVEARRNGKFYLHVDGSAVALLSFHDGLIFSQQDLDSGEWGPAGRFLCNPSTGHIDRIQINGRLACRSDLPAGARCRSLATVSAR